MMESPSTPPVGGTPVASGPPFQVLRPWQLLLLTLLTLGIYPHWFQFRCWLLLRDQYGVPVRPLARTLVNAFIPIYILPLQTLLVERAEQRGYVRDYSPGLFSLAYIALFFAPSLVTRETLMGNVVAALMVMLLALPLMPLLQVTRVLVEADGLPARESPWLSRSDVRVVAFAVALALLLNLLVSLGVVPTGIVG